MYMDELLALDTCRPGDVALFVDPFLLTSGPAIPVGSWWGYLAKHLDQRFAQYILQDLSEGFRIGFDRTHRTHLSTEKTKSANANKLVVSTYIANIACGQFTATPPLSPSARLKSSLKSV